MDTPTGTCAACEKSYSSRGMSRHLSTCLGPGDRLHLAIRDRYDPVWWLHVSVTKSATFADLDGYLRDVWLECCGHLSSFEIGEQRYDSVADDFGYGFGPPPKSMRAKVSAALDVGDRFAYQYDFGSTTHLSGRVVGRVGGPKKRIVQLARNHDVPWVCEAECTEPASWICAYCRTTLCEAHGADEEAQCPECEAWLEESRLPIVNSPRMGVCGYDGPHERA